MIFITFIFLNEERICLILFILVLEELSTYSAVGENFEKEAVRNVSAYDVGRFDVVFHRFKAGFDFGDHAAFYDALLGEVFYLACVYGGD